LEAGEKLQGIPCRNFSRGPKGLEGALMTGPNILQQRNPQNEDRRFATGARIGYAWRDKSPLQKG
tara:strand:+ start:1479 stop:1673 length:195 start_codon:yes stop_codon:yes gene_type:complete